MTKTTRRLLTLLCVCLAFGSTATAGAGVIYTATATSSDGSPLSALTPGVQLIIDVTVRTTDFAMSVEASANGYDTSVFSFNREASSIAGSLLHGVCVASNTCFLGIENEIGSSVLPVEELIPGVGVKVQFLASAECCTAQGDGSIDQDPDGGGSGAPQFQLVFDVIGIPSPSTTINIGTFSEYGDAYSGTVDNVATNTSFTITVPEPSTALLLGLGLSGLARRGLREAVQHN